MNTSSLSSQVATPEMPWLGLRSFTESAHDYFFGRQAELEDLYGRIVDKPLTVLFGQSGLGKSSLIQAALFPCLRENGYLPVRVRIDHEPDAPSPEQQMLGELQEALVDAGFLSHADMIRQGLADSGWEAASFLWLIFHDPACGFLPQADYPVPRPVFLIDQFEEIFTLGERPARRALSHGFREALSALVENRPPSALRAELEADDDLSERINYRARSARVLLSLREDYLHVLERWRRFMPSLMENRIELRMLNGNQALEAVVRPGQLRDGLPSIVPDEVGQAIVRFVAGVEPDVPLAEIDAVPPLLSLVCAELNAQRIASGEIQVSRAQFEGHSDEILQSFYQRSFDSASYGGALTGLSDAESALRSLKRLIEEKLLSPDGYRESIAFDTIASELSRTVSAEIARPLLTEIVERRLLTVEERGGVRRLELAHDVLAPIVRASRDERQEHEALSHAKREQERAESEVRAALQQRNRLRRWVALSLCFAVFAMVAAGFAWFGLEKSKQAAAGEKQATAKAIKAAENADEAAATARRGFESAFHGLAELYDSFANNTLENTPGLDGKQSRLLRSRLRGHLVDQLTKLNAEQPEHVGTSRYLARLLCDEGRDALAESRYYDAQDILQRALDWIQRIPVDSPETAEALAEIILEQVRVFSLSGNQVKADGMAREGLSSLAAFIDRWPQSWRLAYISIRLENVTLTNVNDAGAKGKFDSLVAKLDPLIGQAGAPFDLVRWRFVIATNGLRGEQYMKTPQGYREAKVLAVWFRKNITESKQVTLVQLDIAASDISRFLDSLASQFANTSDPSTRQERRELLVALEAALSPLELRVNSNLNVHEARGRLLRMQQLSVAEGVNTRTADEIRLALERNSLLMERLQRNPLIEVFIPAFAEYTAEGATPETKASALAKVSESFSLLGYLDFAGVEKLVLPGDLGVAVDKLRENNKSGDPMLDYADRIASAYVDLYVKQSRDVRLASLEVFLGQASRMSRAWLKAGEHAKAIALYEGVLKDLPFMESIAGDKSATFQFLGPLVSSMLKDGRFEEASVLSKAAMSMGDRILKERPWDWYARSAYQSFCFEVAGDMKGIDGSEFLVQSLLRRGWKSFARMYAAESALDGIFILPFKGQVPKGSSDMARILFSRYTDNPAPETKGEGGMKRFTIPCDFDGKKYPFHVYIVPGPNGLNEFLDQARWLKEIRGGTVPQDVIDSFTRLWNIAVENKVSFPDLCVYALGTAAAEEGKKVKVETIGGASEKEPATKNNATPPKK